VDATYQVFIERARDGTPEGTTRLAEAIAARYGFPAGSLAQRLAAGRFRVKSNIDLGTAERFAADLERLGADCVIVDGHGAPVSRGRAPSSPQPSYSSGLSAAFAAGRASAPDLGALESGMFSLAAIDGSSDAAPAVPTRPSAAPAPALPASFGPAAAPAPLDFFGGDDAPAVVSAGPPPRPSSLAPGDRFAPPEAHAEAELSLEVESVKRPAGQMAPAALPTASLPVHVGTARSVTAPPPRAPSVAGGTAASAGVVIAPRSLAASGRRWLRDERARFVIGVAIAVVLGFVPAHLVASVRQDAAFTEIDARVTERQAEVTTRDEWAQLDVLRAAQLDRKQAAHRNIVLFAMAVWAAAGGALAYVWFRAIDWQRLAAR
jgi:hypothetical protein